MHREIAVGNLTLTVVLEGTSSIELRETLISLEKQTDKLFNCILWGDSPELRTEDRSREASSKNFDQVFLFVRQNTIFSPNFIKELKFEIEKSGFEECIYYGNYSVEWPKPLDLTRSLVKLPDWSPERFLHNDYLGQWIATNTFRPKYFLDDVNWRTQFILEKIVDGVTPVLKQNLKVRKLSNLDSVTCNADLYRRDDYIIDWERVSGREILKKQHNPTDSLLLNSYSLIREPTQDSVTIVIPTRGTVSGGNDEPLLFECVRSILEQDLTKLSVEIVLVVDNDVNFEYATSLRDQSSVEIKIVEYAPPFNFAAKCNVGADQASGSVIIFLNDDCKFKDEDGLRQLVAHAQVPGVGAVGALLTFPDETIQHAGHIFVEGGPSHAYFRSPKWNGFLNELLGAHEVSGVTGACIAQKKAIFDSTGRWDESFPNNFNDVEYVQRIRANGFRIVQANTVELEHAESATRDPRVSVREIALLNEIWPDVFSGKDNYITNALAAPVIANKFNSSNNRSTIISLVRKTFKLWRIHGTRTLIERLKEQYLA